MPQYIQARLALTPPPSPSFRLLPRKHRLQRYSLRRLSLIHRQPSPAFRAANSPPPGQQNKNAPPSCVACRLCRRCLRAARTSRFPHTSQRLQPLSRGPTHPHGHTPALCGRNCCATSRASTCAVPVSLIARPASASGPPSGPSHLYAWPFSSRSLPLVTSQPITSTTRPNSSTSTR